NSSLELGQPDVALRFATVELDCAQAVRDGATLRARALHNVAISKEGLGRVAEATRDYEAALQALEGPDEDGSRATLRRLISYHLADVRNERDESAEDITALLDEAAFITEAPGLLTSSQLGALNARAWALGERG